MIAHAVRRNYAPRPDALDRDVKRLEHPSGHTLIFAQQPEQHRLGADLAESELAGLGLRKHDNPTGPRSVNRSNKRTSSRPHVGVADASGGCSKVDTVSLLGRNGVACLLGIDGRPRDVAVDGRVLGVDAILQNRALFGSVNAHRQDWETAVESLDRVRRRWPDAVESFIGLTVGVDAFADALAYRGVHARL